VAAHDAVRITKESPAVCLLTVPLFHVYGFTFLLKCVAMMETVVVMERFGLGKMLSVLERFRVSNLVVAPPVVVAMSKEGATERYDLSSLKNVTCGGAPLGKDNFDAFKAKFSQVSIIQVSPQTFNFKIQPYMYFCLLFYSICREESLENVFYLFIYLFIKIVDFKL
jgi:acyl-coenzyme A synthetase/AMP-(fatty) acid ligase